MIRIDFDAALTMITILVLTRRLCAPYNYVPCFKKYSQFKIAFLLVGLSREIVFALGFEEFFKTRVLSPVSSEFTFITVPLMSFTTYVAQSRMVPQFILINVTSMPSFIVVLSVLSVDSSERTSPAQIFDADSMNKLAVKR